MLRTVIHIGPVHILLPGGDENEGQKDADAEGTLDQVPQNGGHLVAQKARQQRGQQDKQHDGDGDAEDHGRAHQHLFQLFRAQLALQPLLKAARLRRVTVLDKICGIGQGAHAEFHGIPEGDHAPHHRQSGPGAVGIGAVGLQLDHRLLPGLAADDGRPLRAAHQDALNERLTGDGGLFSVFILIFIVVCHKRSLLCAHASPEALRYSGRVMIPSVPCPRVLSISSVPPCICTMSLQTERPMPVPRPLALPL